MVAKSTKPQVLPPGTPLPDTDKVWTSIDVHVERHGKKIILPDDPTTMSYDAAIAALARRRDEEAIEFDISEFIAGAYWDAGLAFYKAMQRTYGWVSTQGLVGWFGMRMRPDLVTIRTGPGPKDVVQMPMGEFSVPNLTNPITARPDVHEGVPGFRVFSKAKRAEQAVLIELCNLAREILRTESIYRGYAIRLLVSDDGNLNFKREPEFIDLAKVSETDLVFNADTQRLVDTNLFTPMRKTAVCRQHRVPLKRTVLMEGPYGCGKSLTSRVAAKVAADNDWTFIALERVQGLKSAIEFARLYQPAVIFAEDVDRMGDRDEDENVNDLVNMMDGILTKDHEIIVVLTTNHIDRIDQALLRPGRFDAIIRIDAPDAEAVEKLFRYYAGDLIDADADLGDAAQAVAGQIPATIREVVERAKLGMILDELNHLEPIHLRTAAVGMKRHLELLSPKQAEPTAAELLAQGLVGILGGGITPAENTKLATVLTHARALRSDMSDVTDTLSELETDTRRAGSTAVSTYERIGTLEELMADLRDEVRGLNGG